METCLYKSSLCISSLPTHTHTLKKKQTHTCENKREIAQAFKQTDHLPLSKRDYNMINCFKIFNKVIVKSLLTTREFTPSIFQCYMKYYSCNAATQEMRDTGKVLGPDIPSAHWCYWSLKAYYRNFLNIQRILCAQGQCKVTFD